MSLCLLSPAEKYLPRNLPGLATRALLSGLALSGLLLAGCSQQQAAATPASAASFVRQAPAAAAIQESPRSQAGIQPASIRVAELPRQGQITYQAILAGGPFPFDKDGSVFSNRERHLPRQTRGYYREYTVAPAHARNRGAKRIICGGAPRTPDVCYYTSDHYNSFRQIVHP